MIQYNKIGKYALMFLGDFSDRLNIGIQPLDVIQPIQLTLHICTTSEPLNTIISFVNTFLYKKNS
jgi:hypothetical protein